MRLAGFAVLFAVVASIGCSKKIPPAEEPLRPKEVEEEDKAPVSEKTDCEPTTIGDDLPAKKYGQRSIIEAQNLANEGFGKLRGAEGRGVGRSQKERMITDSVNLFIKALLADPYNVHATYNLAAAYARIERFQCAINLLGRLEALRRLESQKDNVEAKLDRLFGRKKFKGRLDPDFHELRDDSRFRKLAEKLQPDKD